MRQSRLSDFLWQTHEGSADNVRQFLQSEQTAGGGPPVLTVTCVME